MTNEGRFSNILRKLRRPIVFIPLIVFLLIAFFILNNRSKNEDYETVQAVRGNIVQEVTVTGKTKPAESVSLSFEKSGRVVSVNARVGEKVVKGGIVARLDSTSDAISLRQAEANLAVDQATLDELRRGTRPEDIAVLESKVTSAEISLRDARQDTVDKIKGAYSKTDDAIRNYADDLFDNARTAGASIKFPLADNQLKSDVNQARVRVEGLLQNWKSEVDSLNTESNLSVSSSKAYAHMNTVREFLDKLSLAVNSSETNQTYTEAILSGYKASVSTARTAVSAAISSVQTSETSLNNAVAALDIANKNLTLGQAGTVAEKIVAAEARVSADQAAIDSIQHSITQSVLRSPISGTVSKQDAKVGQVVGANVAVAEVVSEDQLEIEAYVPEVDIGGIKSGDPTRLTFDAFPGENFTAKVTYVDPAETIIDGVPTYRVRFSLDSLDARVKPGMTANLSIQIAERSNAVSIPQRALLGKNGERYVNIVNADGTFTEQPVRTGIRGSFGEIEIISGLNDGDTVAVIRKK